MQRLKNCDVEELRRSNAEVKAWLLRYRESKLALRRLQAEYVELLSLRTSVKAINYDGMPHGSGGVGDLSDLIIEDDRMSRRIETASRQSAKYYEEITEAIDSLNRPEKKDVMSMRYIQLRGGYGIWSMEEIGDALGYTPRRVKAIHGIALQELAPIIRNIR